MPLTDIYKNTIDVRLSQDHKYLLITMGTSEVMMQHVSEEMTVIGIEYMTMCNKISYIIK